MLAGTQTCLKETKTRQNRVRTILIPEGQKSKSYKKNKNKKIHQQGMEPLLSSLIERGTRIVVVEAEGHGDEQDGFLH